jgi:putative transposase
MFDGSWVEGTIVQVDSDGESSKSIIRSVKRNEVVIADIITGKVKTTTSQYLQQMLVEGKLKLLAAEKTHGALKFIDLPEREQQETSRKYAYIKKLKLEGVLKVTEKSSSSLIAKIAIERQEDPPHWQSVRKWMKNFIAAGEKMSGLYPKHRFKGSKAAKIDVKVISIINMEGKRFFTSSKPSMASIYRNVEAKIIEHNLTNPEIILEVPSYLTVKEHTLSYHYGFKQKARKGKGAFDAELAGDHSGIKTTRILERAEIDHTDLDLHVIHDDLITPLGRPYITAIVDHYSHMLLGFQLSFENPSFASVCITCANAFFSKSELLKSLNCDYKWPAHGVPETLVTDNGNEFWGNDFAAIADELGAIFQYCPIRKGRYKSRVERFFGIMNTMLLDDLPGVARKQGKAAEGYNAIQHATITFSEFKNHFITWITGVYHNTEVGETGMTPNELWSESEEIFPVPSENIEDLMPILLATEQRKLRKGGIQKFSMHYNSEVLRDIYRRDGPTQVTFKYNKFDIGQIFVLDQVNRVYIAVDCEHYEYAKGVSEYEHDLVRAKVRETQNTKIECIDMQRAKVTLAQERKEFHERNRRRKNKVTSARGARIDQIGIPNITIVKQENQKVLPLTLGEEADDLDFAGWAVD